VENTVPCRLYITYTVDKMKVFFWNYVIVLCPHIIAGIFGDQTKGK